MGAIADAFVAYAQPLLDQTDGSEEEMSKAFAISQLCFTLAQAPADSRNKLLGEMQPALDMDDDELDEFRRTVVDPMIERHREMFAFMHRQVSSHFMESLPSLAAQPATLTTTEKYPVTDRYAPCPCKSGRKYKFCCGKKGR
jgi:uncharacterized protein YecA (UPF0149 family)